MKLTKAQKAEYTEALDRLREWVTASPKDANGRPVVYTVLRSVAPSGMSRTIALFLPSSTPGRLIDITYITAKILNMKIKRKICGEGLHVIGGGMDMGFHLVYELANALYSAPRPEALTTDALQHQWL